MRFTEIGRYFLKENETCRGWAPGNPYDAYQRLDKCGGERDSSHVFFLISFTFISHVSIFSGRFTTSSDVWAFGVTLWEILTLAKEYPYSELTDEEVIDNAQKIFHGTGTPSTRLPQPETCPDDLYQVMCRCWTREMEDRPSFMELHSSIAERVRLSEVSMEC